METSKATLRPLDIDAIPNSLKHTPQWLLWKMESRNGDKPTKVPYDANTGWKAKSNDSRTWCDFPTVVKAAHKYSGIGFAFSNSDGLTGLDLDHVFDPVTQTFEPWAMEIIERFKGTYVEFSPSGTGIRIFCKGKASRCGKGTTEKRVEVYDHTSPRYLTVTGHHLDGTSKEITDQQVSLNWLFETYFAPLSPTPLHATPQRKREFQSTFNDDVAKAAGYLERLASWRADDYEAWVAVGMALYQLGSIGLGLWDNWSHQSSKYKEGACEAKWKSFDGNGLTLGSLHHWANEDDSRSFRTPYNAPLPSLVKPTSQNSQPVSQLTEAYPVELYSDMGNSLRFVRHWGRKFRYVEDWDRWLKWDGTRWTECSEAEVRQHIREMVKRMYAETATIDDDQERKRAVDWARKCENRAKREVIFEDAKSEPPIPVRASQLDADPWLLNCQNGTINLKTGELHPHRQDDLITLCLPTFYDPNATCRQWENFLLRIMNGNPGLVRFIQQAVGYSLAGVVYEHVLFFLYGSGANGKSTLIETIAILLGEGYFQRAPAEMLLYNGRIDNRIPTDVARLRGARLAIASEIEEGFKLKQSLVKDLTGGDTITARFLFKDYFSFKPTHKLWICGNHKPGISGTDEGIWRRVKMIPFNVTIPEGERNPRFKEDHLLPELSGILAWAVRGCLDWQQNGLVIPEEVRRATEAYRVEQDTLTAFLEECCVIAKHATASPKSLFEAYREWAEQNKEQLFSQRGLKQRLEDKGFSQDRHGKNRFWKGIGLLLDDDGIANESDKSDKSDKSCVTIPWDFEKESKGSESVVTPVTLVIGEEMEEGEI